VNDVMSALTRSTGIVATVLAVAALLWGLLFSARSTGTKRRPNWWLDLHNWLGGLALIFTVIHIGTSWLQTNSGIGILQIFVPGTAEVSSAAITWGVLATYLFTLAVFTTWPRRISHRQLWRVLHLGSVIGVGLAMLHAYQSGSDAWRDSFVIGLVVLTGFATYGIAIRLLGLVTSHQTHS
jgi:cytochrome bd-type quinol oxidase subunit 2